MIKERIIETNEGITGEILTLDFDKMQKKMRDMGILETKEIIEYGIKNGKTLEIGPGPGYLGLEWLKNTSDTHLYGLEISKDMKKLSEKNSKEYGLEKRAEYILSDAQIMPFDNNFFDNVFTNGSMHEWSEPVNIFNEIERVLKKSGKFFISDLKRNTNVFIKIFINFFSNKKSMKEGLKTSINAAYTKNELIELMEKSKLKNYKVTENPFGLTIKGEK